MQNQNFNQPQIFNPSMTKLWTSLLPVTAFALLVACSDNAPSTTPPPGTIVPPPPVVVGTIALGTSTNAILTNDGSEATLTATLVDSTNNVIEGADISFSATTGNLIGGPAKTDANGQAIVKLRNGQLDFTSRTATVTASVGGQSANIPILIKGSTLALTLASSNIIKLGTGTVKATAVAMDAALRGRANQTIRFSVGAASTGAGTFTPATLITGPEGVTTPVTFTPTADGTVILTAEWLNSAGVVTVTATANVTVEPTAGPAFAIITPSTNPLALKTFPTTQALAVTVPPTIAGVTVTNVRISATGGTWVGANPVTASVSSIVQTVSSGAVAAMYTAPANSGSVTVQVDALDGPAGATLSSLSRTFVISAPSTDAAQIFLSSSVSTIVPSSGSNISTATLEAIVRDVSYNTVGGAAVIFSLLGTTGSGETVAPAVVYTDSLGKATTTFAAGSAPTLAAIYARANIVGASCLGILPDPTPTAPTGTESNKLCDAKPLHVSAKAVSVTVGFGTTIEDTANTSQYKMPGSVLVVDSNGSAVAGAVVTLTAFPSRYRNGTIKAVTERHGTATAHTHCDGPFSIFGGYTSFTDNEDVNRNGILDDGTLAPFPPPEDTAGNGLLDNFTPSEDTNGNGVLDFGPLGTGGEDVNFNFILDPAVEDTNGNGTLDVGEDAVTDQTARLAMAIMGNGVISPPHAAGGSVPLTVTTDSNGAATFYLQYPKSSAWFIEEEVSARVIVAGTESVTRIRYALPMSVIDHDDPGCLIGHTGNY